MELQIGNRLGGACAPAAAGETFTAGDARWPRSGAEDARRATEALRPGEALDLDLVRCAVARLAADPDPGGHEAALTGLTADEVADEAAAWFGQVDRALEPVRGAERVLFTDDPRERWGATLGALAGALSGGAAVVWVADAGRPHRAVATWDALVSEGLDPGRLQVVIDDGRTARRAVLGQGRADVWCAAVAPEDHAELEREASAPGAAGFGAGVVDARRTRTLRRDLSCGEARVGRDDDPLEAAVAVARAAFARAGARGGTMAAAVGRVHVAPRHLARFTEELLGALEDGHDPELEPLSGWVRRRAPHLDLERDRGLDQGATLIHLGDGDGSGGPRPRSGSAASGRGFRAPRPDATLTRLVFTNVEPRMPLAGPRGPLPCLAVLRAAPTAGDR